MSHVDHHVLLNRLQAASVRPGQHYRHYKTGGVYIVRDIVMLESNDELAVAYADETSPELIWIRPYTDFTATVQQNGQSQPRFKLLGPPQ